MTNCKLEKDLSNNSNTAGKSSVNELGYNLIPRASGETEGGKTKQEPGYLNRE